MAPELARLYAPAIQAAVPTASLSERTSPGSLARYLIAIAPPPGLLPSLPSLRGVLAVGAGVEHILACGDYPAHVPLARLPQRDLVARMSEYIALHVLRAHRNVLAYEGQQRAGQWRMIWPQKAACERSVGILGAGTIGMAAARALLHFGFSVRGWARTGKPEAPIPVDVGSMELDGFLARSEILVNLLPLTPETDRLIGAAQLAQLPRGAHLINAGRGATMCEDAILAALESGALGSATLDVFAIEPLPADHPFWRHPRVTITPHCASAVTPEALAAAAAETIARLEAGETPPHLVDLARGY